VKYARIPQTKSAITQTITIAVTTFATSLFCREAGDCVDWVLTLC
jgi:hypothetical protein